MPNSLIIEGLAQTGGLLVGEHNSSPRRSCWPRSPKAKFHFRAVPGDS